MYFTHFFNYNKICLGSGFMKERKILFQLFISTFYLSAFTFGGGYVIVSLMKKKFVDEYHWIDEEEMLDLVAIAQSSPGPIAVNGAIVVGYKLAGWKGIVVSVLATILPPFFIISIVSLCYRTFKDNLFVSLMLEGMQSGVGAVIASVVYDMARGIVIQKRVDHIMIMLGSFLLSYVFSINVIFIIIGCGFIGLMQSIWERKKEK